MGWKIGDGVRPDRRKAKLRAEAVTRRPPVSTSPPARVPHPVDAPKKPLKKSEGEPSMPPSFWDFLNDSPAAVADRARRAALQKRVTPHRPAEMEQSAVDELEEKVAALLDAEPHLTRQLAVDQVFRSSRALYERVREETTHSTHGRTLRQIYSESRGSFGVDQQGREITKHAIDSELFRRASAVVAKASTVMSYGEAIGAVFAADPEFYELHRRANYA